MISLDDMLVSGDWYGMCRTARTMTTRHSKASTPSRWTDQHNNDTSDDTSSNNSIESLEVDGFALKKISWLVDGSHDENDKNIY